MCRIYGYSGNRQIPIETLNKVAIMQINGGPDGQYVREGENWALGNNRLAIQGLDGGVQPFYLNKIHAVYNGEIYNHKELRKLLETKGYKFQDNCDGAVIIPLYELYGDDFVKYLDGMFAIALVDERQYKKLILVNDPCSVKSVYYYWDKYTDTLYFASELRSLLVFPIEKEIRLEAIDEYLIGRSIWHNKTFFKEVNSLGPASLLVKINGAQPRLSYYKTNVSNHWDAALDFEETSHHFNDLLTKEVEQIVQADVPICVVTSGGLDSSYITALTSKHISNLHCFNIAYEGNWPSDERVFAKEVSEYHGAIYNQVLIKESEFPEILEKTIQHLGQPNSAPHSLSTYALFKAINQQGFKVAITGEGADEYFAGYDRFKKATFDKKSSWLDQYFDTMCATTQKIRNCTYSDNYKNFLLPGKYQLLREAKNKILESEKYLKSRVKALLKFDQNERFTSYILRRVDHLSMANAVEVRVPFCQPRISSFSKTLPEEFLLNQNSVKRIIYEGARNMLPQSVLTRPKQPFTLPIKAMLRKGFVLFDILNETLNSKLFLSRGFFEPKQIRYLIKNQLAHPTGEISDFLWSIMVLELWLQSIDSNLNL
jgi:asparagine synthase (glutamine-hydrolysing)